MVSIEGNIPDSLYNVMSLKCSIIPLLLGICILLLGTRWIGQDSERGPGPGTLHIDIGEYVDSLVQIRFSLHE